MDWKGLQLYLVCFRKRCSTSGSTRSLCKTKKWRVRWMGAVGVTPKVLTVTTVCLQEIWAVPPARHTPSSNSTTSSSSSSSLSSIGHRQRACSELPGPLYLQTTTHISNSHNKDWTTIPTNTDNIMGQRLPSQEAPLVGNPLIPLA